MNFKMNQSLKTLVLVTATIIASGCEQNFGIAKFIPVSEPATSGSPGGSPTGGVGTDTPTAHTFRTLQPALAVRGASCLMCHAQVSANVITDFGNGNNFFFDKDKGTDGFYSDWYSGGVSGTSWWASSIIRGSVYVPKASMDHSYAIVNAQDPKNTKVSMSLAEVVQAKRFDSAGNNPQPQMATGVSPAAGQNAVIEKRTVYIGAPTETEILALAPTLAAPGFKAIAVDGITPDPSLPLSGLQVVSGSGGSYVTNTSGAPFVCAGDVMVKGTLFLNTVTVKTNNKGCRLYVSGSVFIQGPVTYSGAGLTTANMQITSAKLIAMGFDVTSLKRRLSVEGDRASMINYFTTRSTQSPAERHGALAAEAAMISGLADAGEDTSATARNAFTGLLLNAPEVHSRYVGNFKGAVVAEIAMFRLGEFVFTFDPTFQNVPILPALRSDILSFTD